MTQTLLVTGGAGKVAKLLRSGLARPGRALRLMDLRTAAPLSAGEEEIVGSVDDLPLLEKACEGADAVIHLGGYAKENTARAILDVNVYGTYAVLEAAHRAGVGRVILVSSHHAAGYWRRADAPPEGLPADIAARPDTLYGWGKAAAELAGRLYADRYGMDVICLRVGSWCPAPPDLRGLSQWLSPADGNRLIEACLSVPSPGFRVVWGISRNTRRWCSLAAGEEIGYVPQDDAEQHAADLVARFGEPVEDDPVLELLGGAWAGRPLGRKPVTGG